MYYKNYWTHYDKSSELVIICKMTEDMTGFINTEEEKDFEKIESFIAIDRSSYEDARNHLSENGLFLEIFPPELIEAEIKEYNKKQKQLTAKAMEKVKLKYKKPLPQSFFYNLAKAGVPLEKAVREVEISNLMSKEYWGLEYDVLDYLDSFTLFWKVKLIEL